MNGFPNIVFANVFPGLICASIARHNGVPAIVGFGLGIVLGWPALPLAFVFAALMNGGWGRRPSGTKGAGTQRNASGRRSTRTPRDEQADRELEALRERVARAEASARRAEDRAASAEREREAAQDAAADLWDERWLAPGSEALPDTLAELPRARFDSTPTSDSDPANLDASDDPEARPAARSAGSEAG